MVTTEANIAGYGSDAVVYAVVATTNGTPDTVVMAFPSAYDGEVFARGQGLDGYTVVPAGFLATEAPALL